MIDIKINRDMTEYEEKWAGMSIKQLIFGALAVVSGAGGYFLMKRMINVDIAIYLSILFAAPFAAIGFFSYNGMSCVQFLKALIRHYSMPTVLVYRSFDVFETYIYTFRNLNDKDKLSKEDLIKNGNKISAKNETQ